MPDLLLTDAFVKTLRAEIGQTATSLYEDTRVSGLQLRLSPRGKKTWSIHYRPRGKPTWTTATIGQFREGKPDHLTLSEARDKAAAELLQAQGGAKIATKRTMSVAAAAAEAAAAQATIKAEAEQAKLVTVKVAVAAYLAHRLPKLKNDKARYMYQHGFDALIDALGADRPLMEVTRGDLVTILKAKADTAPHASNRLRNKVQGLFKWAADPDGVRLVPGEPVVVLLSIDPSAAIKKQGEVKRHRAKDKRSLTDDELRVLLDAIAYTNTMSPEVKSVLRLIALTSRRPNELCNIEMVHIKRWNEVEHSMIDFPQRVMKGPEPYAMPICPLAREVIQSARDERAHNEKLGRVTKYLFGTQFHNKRGDMPLSPTSVAQALNRFIRESLIAMTPEDQEIVDSLKADRPTPYAFRRTVATGMAPLGISREDRKSVMAHMEDDVLSDHYDKYERLKEKRAALLKWEAHVASVIAEKRAEPVKATLRVVQ